MKKMQWSRLVILFLLIVGGFSAPVLQAQVPARFYLKGLSDANAVPVIFNSISGNVNPFDPSYVVNANANFDATMVLAGYARTFTFMDRSALAAIILPMGRITSDVIVAGIPQSETASGFGDPMLEFNINLIGPAAQKGIPDAFRYEPGFSVDLLADLALPIGEYDNSSSLNIGQNRWYGRVGFPIIWQLGAWVPGRRTTLEFLPALWIYGDNTDFVGQTMSTDPMFQLDAHLSRDFTEHFWGSLDAAWYNGGKATINGIAGEKLNNIGVGGTLGYSINDNLNLTLGYKSTINDNDPTDLVMDGFMISFVYGWHPLIEGSKRLEGE